MDFNKIDIRTLKKYKKHFKLGIRYNANKAQLAVAVMKHFSDLKVDEKSTVDSFLWKIGDENFDNENAF